MKQLYIQGIFNEFAGRRDQAVADLNIYLDNPVGVGEHSDLSVEIKKKLAEVSKYDGLLQVMQKYFQSTKEENSSEPSSEDLPTHVIND